MPRSEKDRLSSDLERNATEVTEPLAHPLSLAHLLTPWFSSTSHQQVKRLTESEAEREAEVSRIENEIT
jgi:hypothetical protein